MYKCNAINLTLWNPNCECEENLDRQVSVNKNLDPASQCELNLNRADSSHL